MASDVLGSATSEESRAGQSTARLVALAKLWGYIKYHDPAIAWREELDWDAALIAAIPRVREATSATEYRAALDSLLATLHDPLTRVVAPAVLPKAERAGTAAGLTQRVTADSILVVTVRNYYSLSDATSQAELQRALASIKLVRAVVLDVRSATPTDPYAQYQLTSHSQGLLEVILRKLGHALVKQKDR